MQHMTFLGGTKSRREMKRQSLALVKVVLML